MAARLETVLSLLPPCDTLYDIGTDHGQLPALALRAGVCRRAVLSDISAPSLDKARALFARENLSGTFHVSDGLEGLCPTQADAISICGMGAPTMLSILRAGVPCPVVLQANVRVEALRKALPGMGLRIERERLAKEGRRFYVCILARPGSASAESERDDYIGMRLVDDPLFYEYMRWRERVLLRALADGSPHEDLRRQLSWVREGMACKQP